MKRVCVFFADGTEECEALLVVDILRRAKIEVVTASINGTTQVCSSHAITLQTDATVEQVQNQMFDAVVVPGGLPGTTHLAAHPIVKEMCVSHAKAGKLVAAICAAPSALAQFGLLEGVHATAHAGFIDKLAGAVVVQQPVVVDGNITTGWGLGAAIPFALSLVEQLLDQQIADSIANAIGYANLH